jgi:hypothetical protein
MIRNMHQILQRHAKCSSVGEEHVKSSSCFTCIVEWNMVDEGICDMDG